jgi:hypothetical protein
MAACLTALATASQATNQRRVLHGRRGSVVPACRSGPDREVGCQIVEAAVRPPSVSTEVQAVGQLTRLVDRRDPQQSAALVGRGPGEPHGQRCHHPSEASEGPTELPFLCRIERAVLPSPQSRDADEDTPLAGIAARTARTGVPAGWRCWASRG